MLQGVECIQILDMGERLSEQYYFRSICNYYAYLFLRFLNKKPLVARCHCCGNYFIPKTRKMTLYCDRIFKNGKTCKQIGPTLKHRLNIEKDEVLKTFDKVKQKMYKRYERQNDAVPDFFCVLQPSNMGLGEKFCILQPPSLLIDAKSLSV